MNKFAAYISESEYITDVLQSKTCDEYVKMVHFTAVTEYRNWEVLIRDIPLYNNMVIFSYSSLGKTFKEIIRKIDELRHHNSKLKLYSIMDKSWYEGGQETLSETDKEDNRNFQQELVTNSSLYGEKYIIKFMTLMKHFKLTL